MELVCLLQEIGYHMLQYIYAFIPYDINFIDDYNEENKHEKLVLHSLKRQAKASTPLRPDTLHYAPFFVGMNRKGDKEHLVILWTKGTYVHSFTK
jgi:hypothetical protein